MTAWRDNPTARIIADPDGGWWHENPNDPQWTMLGFAPTPRGPWETFRYHVLLGLLNSYRLRDVLPWSWSHRRSFDSGQP